MGNISIFALKPCFVGLGLGGADGFLGEVPNQMLQ